MGKRVQQCKRCQWLDPPEYARYWRLWDFLQCRACRKPVHTIDVCPDVFNWWVNRKDKEDGPNEISLFGLRMNESDT